MTARTPSLPRLACLIRYSTPPSTNNLFAAFFAAMLAVLLRSVWMAKKVLKGTRWLLLKNPENLDDERDERKRLEKALALNKPLATVYYMKEDLRQIWDQQDQRAAEVFLDDWIARARASGIRMLLKFAETLVQHRRGILNYYQCPITTAALEGTNNKIKTMQRQAYGFRDREFFKLKIFALHKTRYALVG